MTRIRKNVYDLPPGDVTLAWYAKAVDAMRKRPSTDPTSWNYQAAIHGIYPSNPFWASLGPAPSPTEQSQYWNQCQHGSWFFLPWHRMYLAYFEEIVAATIVDLGGPSDWALPFWNYSDTANQPQVLSIPPEFTSGSSATNPLQMPSAGGNPGRDSTTVAQVDTVLTALNIPVFAGAWRGATQGFGGPVTTFSHGGGTHGGLEHLPHDFVHVDIGGAMGDPDTAGLDPIFWLHHANIDRLWQVWLNQNSAHINPVNPNWLNYAFDFHDSTGARVTMTPAQVLDTTKVLSGYTYEGVPTAVGFNSISNVRTGTSAFSTFSTTIISPQAAIQLAAAANETAPEILAASNGTAVLGDQPISATLNFLPENLRRVTQRSNLTAFSFNAFGIPAHSGGEAFLNFENITGSGIPPVYDVYVHAGPGAPRYAGSLPFFGVASSSRPSTHNSGSGQQYILDISDLRLQMQQENEWDDTKLNVTIQPRHDPKAGSSVQIGRISLYVK